jgi:hypothetical protein
MDPYMAIQRQNESTKKVEMLKEIIAETVPEAREALL